MTKRLLIIAGIVTAGIVMISCNKVRRSPGRIYMPDMHYSQAHETYSSNEGLKQRGVNYNGMPVQGTIARGDLYQYPYKKDTVGAHAASAVYVNPLDSSMVDLKEAERLYLVFCGICHGSKLDGNGPLYKGGNGPFVAAPAVLVGNPNIEKLAPGQIFHVITHGKNAMGSYASQLSPEQRWQVVAYIKSKQGAKPASVPATDTSAVKTDTTAVQPPK